MNNKKNTMKDSHIIQKVKDARVYPSKDFKNNLLHSLEQELRENSQIFLWHDFNFLQKFIMISKKIAAGALISSIAIIGLGTMNITYAEEKDGIIDYFSSGFDFIADGIDYVNPLNDEEFIKLTGFSKEQFETFKKDAGIESKGIGIYEADDGKQQILMDKSEEFSAKNIQDVFGKNTKVEVIKLSERQKADLIKRGLYVEVDNDQIKKIEAEMMKRFPAEPNTKVEIGTMENFEKELINGDNNDVILKDNQEIGEILGVE